MADRPQAQLSPHTQLPRVVPKAGRAHAFFARAQTSAPARLHKRLDDLVRLRSLNRRRQRQLHRSSYNMRAYAFTWMRRRLPIAERIVLRLFDMPHLELCGLTKRYGASTSIDAIDFAVERGEFICLLGPS